MPGITKEQVEAKAKELSLTLTPEQVAAYVTLDVLPGSSPGNGDGNNDSPGVKARIDQLSERAKAEKKRADELAAKVKEFEDAKNAQNTKDAEAKGEYEKLKADAAAAKKAAEDSVKAMRDNLKSTLVTSKLESELLKAGVPADRLAKAVKLFDVSKVPFTWTDEQAQQYEIKDFASEIESFKKDNDFLFGEPKGTPDASGRRQPPQGGGSTIAEKEIERLAATFPALRNRS